MQWHSGLWLIVLLSVSVSSLHAREGDRALNNAQWAADLQQLDAAIREIHFKPFHVVPEPDFANSVAELEQRLPGLSDSEIILEMAAIVASLRDGHTRLHIPRLYPERAIEAELGHSGTSPPRLDALKFSQAPVQFGLFKDGLFVVAAIVEHRKLPGQKVLAFDATPVEEAIEKVRAVSFFENDSRARLMAPDRLALPQVLAHLEITNEIDTFKIQTVDAEGEIVETSLRVLDDPGHEFPEIEREVQPLWLTRTAESHWYQVLDARDAIYVQVNRFEESPATPYGDFVAETIAVAGQAGVSRYIVDLRHNSGGVGTSVIPFVTGLPRSEFNEYGKLFVLTSLTTFSAAQHFLHRFEELTYAMFVGEPSGAKPSHFGDAQKVVLENSGLTLRVSTIYWNSWLANDFRDAISPHLSAPLTSSAYFNGQDPALKAALEYQAPPTLALQMEEQFRRGKNQNALLLFQRYMTDGTLRDHRQAVPGLVQMADRLVKDGMVRPGYFVYFLLDQSYPGDSGIEAGLKRVGALLE